MEPFDDTKKLDLALARIEALEAALKRILVRTSWDNSDDLNEFRRQMAHIEKLASAALAMNSQQGEGPL